jgi:ATP-binding cassette subfamily F protein 3
VLSRKDEKRAEARQRQKIADVRKPFEKKLAAIEAELDPLSREASEAEAWLASGEAYSDENREKLQEMLRRRGEVAARIARLEEDWLWAQAALEKELERAARE